MADQVLYNHGWRFLFCTKCGHRIRVLVDCGHRFCPNCSRRRARRVRNRLQALIDKNEHFPKARLKMLTVSQPNCVHLDDGIKKLVAAFRRLRQRALWDRYVFGGAFVIEVKGRPGNWHPHIHAVIYSYRIPWRRLRSSWRQCSGGTACWISNVTADKAKNYITKYMTKTDLPSALIDDVSTSLRRFRLFTRFGSWHNIVLPKMIMDTPCDSCGSSEWIVDFEIDRMLRAFHRDRSRPPPRSSLSRGAKVAAETSRAAAKGPLRAAREVNPPPLLL